MTVTMKRCPTLIGIALLMLGLPSVSAGAPITGVMNTAGDFRINTSLIDFLPPIGLGTGEFRLTLTQEGFFVPLADTTGDAQDLNRATAPAGLPILILAFLTLDADANVRFDLTQILPGSFSSADCFAPPAAGQTCTPAADAFGLNPLNLRNTTVSSSTLGLSVAGNAVNIGTGESTPFTGTFSTLITDKPFQDVLAVINGGGSLQASYTASFVVGVVPEPGTAAMGFVGLLLFGFLARRFRSA
jgi:PEP-CTERM motif-containing protein